jgi:tetratricopeptide (TPR) repeat protein
LFEILPLNNLLQKASDYLKSQKYSKAISCTKTILNNQPGQPSALFMQAVAYSEIGNFPESLLCFKTLIKLHPNNSEVYYNFGIILEKFEKTQEAIEAYKTATQLNSRNPFVYNNYANQLYKIGDYTSSINAYKQALLFDPTNSGFVKNLIQSLFANKNFNQCIQELIKLSKNISLDVNDLNILIQSFIQVGNYREAYKLSLKSTIEHPNDYMFYHLLGLSALKMCRYPIAVKSLLRSVELNNTHTTSYMNLAISYSYLAQYNESNTILNKLITLTNNDIDTIHFVCKLREMQNEINLETPYFTDAIKLYPNDYYLKTLKAQLLINSKQYDESILLLKSVVSNSDDGTVTNDAYYLLAKAYDKIKAYDLAWIEYGHANSLNTNVNQTDTFNAKIVSSLNQIKKIKFIKPKVYPTRSGLKVVFIMGFPRSGTTLIDSILSCNSSSIVLEEVPLIEDIANHILENVSFDKYYNKLINLTESELQEYRELYINNISLYHEWNGSDVIIDKSPINMFHTLLIHLLFPEAPIVFAVRHPLDVCISCFMQNFRSSGELINNFKDINLIASTYNNLLSLWDKILTITKLNYQYLLYEELVSDFDIQVKSLVKFVQFEWSDKYLTFYQQTKLRGMIHTPSYNQVNKPINRDSKFRFNNYLNQIEPIIDDTKQWQEYFKYI